MIKKVLRLPLKAARILKHKLAEHKFIKKIMSRPIILDASKKTFTIPNQSIKDLKIACIMDPFTYGAYSPEANFQQLTPKHWKNEITTFTPDMLLIESAWRGKDELWWNTVPKKCDELVDIVNYCNTNNIPTVFWNKEDPVHFNTFIHTATLFDFVFTTDVDMIGKYKVALRHNRVFILPFACQPKINNPIEKYPRKDAFCFAGAYYVRYPERTKDLDEFIKYLPTFKPLEIYDRNYGKKDTNYMFPDAYKPFIVSTLPFEEIDKAYKGYNYAINLNSVKQSQSMFARRIYEVLASNTITVSNFSRAVRLLFSDLVITSDDGEEILKKLQVLNSDKLYMKKHKLTALRKVLSEHTYGNRFGYMIEKVFGSKQNDSLPHVAIFCQVNNEFEYQQAISIFHAQTYKNTFLYLVSDDALAMENSSNTSNIKFISNNTQENIETVFKNIDYIAGIDTNDHYGENYITDLALATLYFDGDIIGKASYYTNLDDDTVSIINEGSQYTFVDQIQPQRAIIKKEFIASSIAADWIRDFKGCIIEQDGILSIDEFNYCQNGADLPTKAAERFLDDKAIKSGVDFDMFEHKIKNTTPVGVKLDPHLLSSPTLIGKEKYLLLTNIYPSYNDLYRNGFVHARVKAYKRLGVDVDVFQVHKYSTLSYDEFEDVDVTTGSKEALQNLLQNNTYESVLIHFLDKEMWSILQEFVNDIKIIVWVHGFEIQPWYRRKHLFETKHAVRKAKRQSKIRLLFWQSLLKVPHKNLQFIFVSQYLADSVMEDLRFNIPEENYKIIHNFINSDLFTYIPKEPEQRKKILSVRPYANTNYANDLSIKAILELSEKPYFNELEFRLIGDGILFDEIVKPLRGFDNVIIEKRFLSQQEIAAMHKEYGIFLCPSRIDTQGVSRDEAMSSGLVPVTNGVTAIPEFVDTSCGILAGEEDAHGLAEGIAKLYENPELFQKMSEAAAKKVRKQCNFNKTIGKELTIFNS